MESPANTGRFRQIREEFKGQPVAFFMLNPQIQDDRASIAKEAEEFGYDFPILVDEAQLVAESLGVDRTAEISSSIRRR